MKFPNYIIRYSKRAKHVRLSISAAKGLEVVLPFNSNADCIPQLLIDKQDWIAKHQNMLVPISKPCLPETIHLQAIGQKFTVNYIVSKTSAVEIDQRDMQINVLGQVDNESEAQRILIKGIKLIAKPIFVSRINAFANEYNYDVAQVKVKSQKTRWGSCSSKGNINLNYKLLFMPESYLVYVLLHELSHTRVMNHSALFWHELEKVLPDCKKHDKKMNTAHIYLPKWLDYEFTAAN